MKLLAKLFIAVLLCQTLADQNILITAGRDVQLLQATDSQTASNGNLTINADTDPQYKNTGATAGAESFGNLITQDTDLLAKGDVTLSGNRVDLDAALRINTTLR